MSDNKKTAVLFEIDVRMGPAWVTITNTERGALVVSDPQRVLVTPERVAAFKNALTIALSELNSQISSLPLDTNPR